MVDTEAEFKLVVAAAVTRMKVINLNFVETVIQFHFPHFSVGRSLSFVTRMMKVTHCGSLTSNEDVTQ